MAEISAEHHDPTTKQPIKTRRVFSPRMSRMLRSKDSKQCRWVIGASSHMIKELCAIKSARKVPLLILHTDVSSITIGILNRECALRPLGSNREATPDEATSRMISFSDHMREIIAFQRNVLPMPPHPYTKNTGLTSHRRTA